MNSLLRIVLCFLAVAAAAVPEVRAQSKNEPAFPDEKTAVTSDWMQIDSHEWLKGHFLGMYAWEVEFDSADLDLREYDWDTILQLRTAQPMEVGLANGAVAVGRVTMIGNRVLITGDGTIEIERAQIVSIGQVSNLKWSSPVWTIFRKWSGDVSLGLTILAGNTDQTDLNLSGKLRRRSVKDNVSVDYIANISNSNNQAIANSQRLNADWARFLTTKFFIKPTVGEWYSDRFQNIDSRSTLGVGAGYEFFQTPRLKWEVSSGVGYQVTQFVNVSAGRNDSPKTAAFVGATTLEKKMFKNVKLTYEYRFNIVNESSGQYTHHMLTMIETGWTRLLDLDFTIVWDRTQKPQPGEDGITPKRDDVRMVVALGIEF
jgi:putative salt-induced outer membrane protein YdiY